MMRPLFRLITTQPQLLVDHAEAYGELMCSELGTSAAVLKRRVLLDAIALCALGVAAALAGVATMLLAVTPDVQREAVWALALTPVLPFVAALGCWVAAHWPRRAEAFPQVRRQVRADMRMLRDVGA